MRNEKLKEERKLKMSYPKVSEKKCFFQEILDHYLRLTPPNSPEEYGKIKELATQVFKTKIENHKVHDFCECKVELCFCKWDTDCHCTFC